MLDFIIIASIITTILLVWFRTDAVAEYFNFFGVTFFLKGYNNNKNTNTFAQYLTENKSIIANGNKLKLFYLKLITCPYCINFWLCLFGSIFLHNIFLAPVLYIVTLFLFLKALK